MADIKKTWDDYPMSEITRLSLNENEFDEPTPIQCKSLKAALIDDKHILGAARTGSGKTLAYTIPIIERILNYVDKPCSLLKQKLSTIREKKQDFEIVDDDQLCIQDMIADKPGDLVDEDFEFSPDQPTELVGAPVTDESSCPEALILVPTRELASQVASEMSKVCKRIGITTCFLIGGLNQDKQIRTLRKMKPQVVIGTPGRLYEIIRSESVSHLNVQSVGSIRTLVIDEADRMTQKGHFQEMMKIIDIVNEFKKFRSHDYECRLYLFSATLTFLHESPDRLKLRVAGAGLSKNSKDIPDTKKHNRKYKIRQLVKVLMIEPSKTRVIDLNDEKSFGRPASEQLKEMKVHCNKSDKDLMLYYFIVENPSKRILVFCNSKDCLRRLVNVVKFLKINVLKLHADMDQKKRLMSLEKFRATSGSVLIATDVAARGLDIKNLECVVHYQVPKTCESYIHRSGRTARLSEKGISLTLCDPKEAFLYRRLCNTINNGQELEDYVIDHGLLRQLRLRVSLAQQCDTLDHHLRETKTNKDWFVRAAEKCDIELDEEDHRRLIGKGNSHQQNIEDEAKRKRRLSHMKGQLDKILNRPLVTRRSLNNT